MTQSTFLAALLAAAICASSPAQAKRSTAAEYPPLAAFDIANHALLSRKAPQLRVRYSVYVPKGYANAPAKRRYPCLIWLGGAKGPFRFPCATVLDRLRQRAEIPELLFVVPHVSPPNGAWCNGSRVGDLEDLVTDELLPALQRRYRVSKAAADRGLLGIERAGFAAWRIAIGHPDLFGVAAAHSPVVLPETPAELTRPPWQLKSTFAKRLFGEIGKIDAEAWRTSTPLAMLAARDADDPLGVRLYFDQAHGHGRAWTQMAELFHERLDVLGVDHEFALVDVGRSGERRKAAAKALPRLLEFATTNPRNAVR